MNTHIFISEYIFNYIIPLGNKIEIFIYFFFLFCLSQTFVLFFMFKTGNFYFFFYFLNKFYEYPALKIEFDNCFF